MSFHAPMMHFAIRFYCLLFCLGAGLTEIARADDWHDFQRQFVTADGRIVDTGQGGISHSEGQGAGMLLAEAAGDRAAFDRIWEWTRQHLQVRDDRLLAWRWSPTDGITDRNNASDGDILVAWALIRARKRWRDQTYLDSALAIAQDLRKKAIRASGFGPVLLPGVDGFERPDGLVVNLSYWIFPALRDLAQADAAPEWAALGQSGLALLGASRFGRWQLPADWVFVKGDKLALAEGFPDRFGYDAIRIPLYLYWAGLQTDNRMRVYQDYWGFFAGARFMPAWTRLSDDSVDSHGASVGQLAVVSLLKGKTGFPSASPKEDYYSAVLRQFCRLAALESRHRPP